MKEDCSHNPWIPDDWVLDKFELLVQNFTGQYRSNEQGSRSKNLGVADDTQEQNTPIWMLWDLTLNMTAICRAALKKREKKNSRRTGTRSRH